MLTKDEEPTATPAPRFLRLLSPGVYLKNGATSSQAHDKALRQWSLQAQDLDTSPISNQLFTPQRSGGVGGNCAKLEILLHSGCLKPDALDGGVRPWTTD